MNWHSQLTQKEPAVKEKPFVTAPGNRLRFLIPLRQIPFDAGFSFDVLLAREGFHAPLDEIHPGQGDEGYGAHAHEADQSDIHSAKDENCRAQAAQQQEALSHQRPVDGKIQAAFRLPGLTVLDQNANKMTDKGDTQPAHEVADGDAAAYVCCFL